jgi:hypothetical protein
MRKSESEQLVGDEKMRKHYVKFTKDEKGEEVYPPKYDNWFLISKTADGKVNVRAVTEPPKGLRADHADMTQALKHLAELHPASDGWIAWAQE